METKYGLVVYPKAAEDIESIFRYISVELENPTAAGKFIDKFYTKLENIRYFPKSMPQISNVAVKNKNLRKLVIDNYILFYNINETQRVIEVVRVLYGMMNWQNLL